MSRSERYGARSSSSSRARHEPDWIVITPEREAEYQRVIRRIQGWATGDPGVRGVAVVGSWVRGAARMECVGDRRIDSGIQHVGLWVQVSSVEQLLPA